MCKCVCVRCTSTIRDERRIQRAERKFPLMPPFICKIWAWIKRLRRSLRRRRFKQKKEEATKRKSAVENPFIKILRDDYETAYKIRRRRQRRRRRRRWCRWWWHSAQPHSEGQCDTAWPSQFDRLKQSINDAFAKAVREIKKNKLCECVCIVGHPKASVRRKQGVCATQQPHIHRFIVGNSFVLTQENDNNACACQRDP